MFVGDPVEWLLPMPGTLVLVVLVFWAWSRWRPEMRRSRRLLGTLLGIWLSLGAIPFIGNAWVKGLEGTPVTVSDQLEALGHVDAVVVPGSGGPGVNSSKAVQHLPGYVRVMAGVQTWKKTGGLLILMGGMANTPEDSLAAFMREMAMGLGVPAEAIRIVTDSRTTQEDMQGAVDILAEHFPASAPAAADRAPGRSAAGRGRVSSQARVVLVTSAIHMPRTLATARQLGIDPIPVRCDFVQISRPGWRAWLPNNGAPWLFRQALHESVGLWVYRWRGWAE